MSTSLIFVIAPVIILLVILVGGLLAWIIAGFDSQVKKSQEEIKNEDTGYNLSQTYGYRIQVTADSEEQMREARLAAAQLAASTPRGANAPSFQRGKPLQTAGDQEALQHDPLTAAKIAEFHGWDGVHTGFIAAPTAPAVGAAPTAVPAGPIKLVPGKDYPVIEITDDMSPDEKRKARIANSKAKSAAMKKAKAAQQAGGAAPVAAAPVAGQPAPVAAPVTAAPVDIEPPQLIEMTDDMAPDEKRKARIANSKAKSAFNKQLKAAGIDPKTVEIKDGKVVLPAAVAAAAPAQQAGGAAPVAAPAAAAPVDIEAPELIEITDGMDPDEKRKARIANSKAKSAFNKQLKAAGIDPKTVEIVDGKVVVAGGAASAAAPAAPVVETAVAAPAPAPAEPAVTADIPQPEYIEITDDMSPDEKRQARIANAKAKSAYNKALKAAGIDPKSVK
ncbi:MAG TPA: hypothetical protein EYP41_12240 [Anaerolineae bacterium]|nr:hypothetical protein [Anaerolineae bacterium]